MSVQHVTEQLPWQCSLVSSSLNKCIKPIYSRACARPWNSWNTPAWEHCPSPGPSQTHRNPCRVFTSPVCSPGVHQCTAPHPQETCPGDGAHAWQTPAADLPLPRLHKGVRGRGPPTVPPQQSSCPHCASPSVPPARGGGGWIPWPGVVLGAGRPS